MSIASVQQETGSPIVMPRLSVEMAGALACALGAWGGIVPFVGPIFGFSADGSPAWTWNLPHALLFLAPGAVAFVGGLAIIAGGRSVLGRHVGLALAGALVRDRRRVVHRRAVSVAGAEERERLQPELRVTVARVLDRILAWSGWDPDRARLIRVRAPDAARHEDAGESRDRSALRFLRTLVAASQVREAAPTGLFQLRSVE